METGCNCCREYADYLDDGVEAPLQVTEVESLSEEKRSLGVPRDLWSCHTAHFGDYLVEGHVPLAAVEELNVTDPEIDGIALPGMPAGSPGMGGTKSQAWTIYGFGGADYTPFIEL